VFLPWSISNKSLTSFQVFIAALYIQVPRCLDPYHDEPWYQCEQNCERAVLSCKRSEIWSMINRYVDKTSPSMKTGLVRRLFWKSFVEPHQSLTFCLDLSTFSFNVCAVQATLPLTFCGMKVCLACWRRKSDWRFLKTGCRGEILDKESVSTVMLLCAGENYAWSVIFNPHKIYLGS
jgi:hypothetical protein